MRLWTMLLACLLLAAAPAEAANEKWTADEANTGTAATPFLGSVLFYQFTADTDPPRMSVSDCARSFVAFQCVGACSASPQVHYATTVGGRDPMHSTALSDGQFFGSGTGFNAMEVDVAWVSGTGLLIHVCGR